MKTSCFLFHNSVYENQQLTYQELNRKVNQLASYLQSLDVAPETMVGICLERSLEMVIGLYGIIKAGGAYVPIDPEYPEERLQFMLEDTNAPVILTQSKFYNELKQINATSKIIPLDTDQNWQEQKHTKNFKVQLTPDNLAYMIYTSGSTGKPKGAMNTHIAICNRLLWMQDAYQLTSEDKILQKTPFSFDVSVWEFFWPLITDASLVVAKPGGHKDSNYLVEFIIAQGITTLHFVPSMMQIFVQDPNADKCQSIQRVICSGEALPFDLQEKLFERLPDVNLYNLYGPTEAAIDVTHWTCQKHSSLKKVPIGAGGNVLYFQELAINLGKERPFYALQPPGLDGTTPPLTSIENLATHYIKTIKTVQKTGPYYLDGHSFGGLVAFEMAQQLIKNSENVHLLAILDCPSPTYYHPTGEDWDEARWLTQISGIISHLYGKDIGITEDSFQPFDDEEKLVYLHETLKACDFLPKEAKLAHFKGFVEVYKTNLLMTVDINKDIYPSNLVLFKSTDRQPHELEHENTEQIREDHTLGWNQYLSKEIAVCMIPGDHLTMLTDPNVKELATQMNSYFI